MRSVDPAGFQGVGSASHSYRLDQIGNTKMETHLGLFENGVYGIPPIKTMKKGNVMRTHQNLGGLLFRQTHIMPRDSENTWKTLEGLYTRICRLIHSCHLSRMTTVCPKDC